MRGADWLYNYFLGFYRDDAAATGWNNLVFPNVAMPHVLWQLSGTNRLVTTEFKSHDEAQAAALAAKGLVLLAPGKDDTFIVETLAPETPGTLSPTEYKAMVADLVNYLDYMAEPAKNKRISLGLARAPVPRRAVCLRLLAQARILEGRSLAAIVKLLRGRSASLLGRSESSCTTAYIPVPRNFAPSISAILATL